MFQHLTSFVSAVFWKGILESLLPTTLLSALNHHWGVKSPVCNSDSNDKQANRDSNNVDVTLYSAERVTKCLTQGVSNQGARLCPNRSSCKLLQTHEIPSTGFSFCTNHCNFLYLFVIGKFFPCVQWGMWPGCAKLTFLSCQQELKTDPWGFFWKRKRIKFTDLFTSFQTVGGWS